MIHLGQEPQRNPTIEQSDRSFNRPHTHSLSSSFKLLICKSESKHIHAYTHYVFKNFVCILELLTPEMNMQKWQIPPVLVHVTLLSVEQFFLKLLHIFIAKLPLQSVFHDDTKIFEDRFASHRICGPNHNLKRGISLLIKPSDYV